MGTLYIVATPIGNLEDITLRALRILKEVDLIACEDTRQTGILLTHYKIQNRLVSFHQHSRLEKIDFLVESLIHGKNIALVTDAGTPGIADPAGRLLEAALKSKIKIVPIPGPSALTALLSLLPQELGEFHYIGFFPKKKGRQTLMEHVKTSREPVIFFESPHRITKTLTELKERAGDPEVIVGRELTKKFEQIYRGKISTILPQLRPQGEFVVIILNQDA